MSKTILLVEDDPFVARSIQQVLPPEYRLDVRKSLATSYSYLNEKKPEIIVLDRTLPDGDGIELAEHLQSSDYGSQVLIISGKTMVHDRIEGLRKGADDYLTKPFSTTELLLKLEKMLRTTKQLPDGTVQVGEITLIADTGQVLLGKHIIKLRKREFQILSYFARNTGRVLSREQIINRLWPDGVTPSYATIDVYIRRLRMMLGTYGNYIHTMKGYGYIFKAETDHLQIAASQQLLEPAQ